MQIFLIGYDKSVPKEEITRSIAKYVGEKATALFLRREELTRKSYGWTSFSGEKPTLEDYMKDRIENSPYKFFVSTAKDPTSIYTGTAALENLKEASKEHYFLVPDRTIVDPMLGDAFDLQKKSYRNMCGTDIKVDDLGINVAKSFDYLIENSNPWNGLEEAFVITPSENMLAYVNFMSNIKKSQKELKEPDGVEYVDSEDSIFGFGLKFPDWQKVMYHAINNWNQDDLNQLKGDFGKNGSYNVVEVDYLSSSFEGADELKLTDVKTDRVMYFGNFNGLGFGSPIGVFTEMYNQIKSRSIVKEQLLLSATGN